MAAPTAPAGFNDKSFAALGISLGLTIVVLIVCNALKVPEAAGQAFAGVAGSVPSAIAITMQRRRVRAVGPAMAGVPTSPWSIVILVATVSLVFDTLVGMISFGLAADAATEAEAGQILVLIGGVGLLIIALAIAAISKRFGPYPYRWTSITVGIIFAVRVVVIVIFGYPELIGQAAVGHAFLLVASLLATLAAVKLRRQPTGNAVPVVYGPVAAPHPYPPPMPTTVPAPAPVVPAGWYADPQLRGIVRYWDGSTWTDHRRNA